jgi:hypothetical protein
MKYTAIAAIILAGSLLLGGCTAERYSRYYRDRSPKPDTLAMLKTQDVISMSKAGVSDSLIITMLEVSHSWFQLKPQDVIDLKNSGVSDRVIDAMLYSSQAMNERGAGSGDGAYAYPPDYWYWGYYPYWYYPYWYYPSFYLGYGFRYSYPGYGYRSGYFGHYYAPSGGRGSVGGGGRHR